MFNLQRIATCTPSLKVADVAHNAHQILELACQAHAGGAAVAIFPELSFTGATCGDLFFSNALLDAVETTFGDMLSYLPSQTLYLVGCPLRMGSALVSAAVAVQNGAILGIVPKTYIAALGDMAQARWFTSSSDIRQATCNFAGKKDIPVGTDMLFSFDSSFSMAVELGDDMELSLSPAAAMTFNGATLVANLCASPDYLGKAERRINGVAELSRRYGAAYALAASGNGESTTDCVFGGHQLIAECGELLAEAPRFQRNAHITMADIDLDRILHARRASSLFRANVSRNVATPFRTVTAASLPQNETTIRNLPQHPFIPDAPERLQATCRDTFAIQTAGLAKRMEHTSAQRLVLGISGGLDSTLALLVCVETLKQLGRPATDLITVTMPGFGTTDRTYNNAVGLCRALGTELREISIRGACLEHFLNIGHDQNEHNVVYENAQARERTQILLDIANKVNGIAVGTGDLSESAMGWCTFNGDHIAMYGVNASVPKTLIPQIILWYGADASDAVRRHLQDVIDTPVSPELLPAAPDGQIKQKTEDIIGPYEVHDFFLYHYMASGASPEKLLFLATAAFGEKLEKKQLKSYLAGFLCRFITQQFKRSCSPDAPQTGEISLSPRGALAMPSDASFALWLNSI